METSHLIATTLHSHCWFISMLQWLRFF